MTAASTLLNQLERHYIGPEDLPGGVFLRELQLVREGRTSRADAVYLSFTRSRGWGIDVAEVKVSRADYLTELSKPVKAEAWWRHSSRFWIVSPGPDVTPVDLLPEGWGLMCPQARGRRFKVHRPAADRHPEVDLALLIEIAKKLDTIRAQAVYEAKRAAEDVCRDRLRQATQTREASQMTPSAAARVRLVAELEEATGLTLDGNTGTWWGSGDFRTVHKAQFFDALKLALALVRNVDEGRREAEATIRTLNQMTHYTRRLDEALATAADAAQAIAKGAA